MKGVLERAVRGSWVPSVTFQLCNNFYVVLIAFTFEGGEAPTVMRQQSDKKAIRVMVSQLEKAHTLFFEVYIKFIWLVNNIIKLG